VSDRSIPLSQKRGVNPHLTFCPRCHGEANELVLTGSHHQHKCNGTCDTTYFGLPKNRAGQTTRECQRPGCFGHLVDQGEIPSETKLPASQPCDACKAEIKTFDAEIERGGIPIRCKDCGMRGVIKAEHELAKKVRAQNDGKVMGLEFSKTDCPKCGPQEVTK
jgi:DNA-directed RNA polymerase subunit RPC12/RpoP